MVALNAPQRRPVAGYDDVLQYAQRRVDVLDLQANQLVTKDFEQVARESPIEQVELFASRDERLDRYPPTADRQERFPWVLTFDSLLGETDYVPTMRRMLRALEEAYECPVDVEFTTNFRPEEGYLINLVQCRPLQIKRLGTVAEPPKEIPPDDLIFQTHGAVMGHGRIARIDRIIYVVPSVYGKLPLRDRYSVARAVGKLVHLEGADRAAAVALLGPGRWGTSMPSLGVPVSFAEISTVTVLGEIVVMHEHLVPDVSLGTHFFNELVEADTLYFAMFPDRERKHAQRHAVGPDAQPAPRLVARRSTVVQRDPRGRRHRPGRRRADHAQRQHAHPGRRLLPAATRRVVVGWHWRLASVAPREGDQSPARKAACRAGQPPAPAGGYWLSPLAPHPSALTCCRGSLRPRPCRRPSRRGYRRRGRPLRSGR